MKFSIVLHSIIQFNSLTVVLIYVFWSLKKKFFLNTWVETKSWKTTISFHRHSLKCEDRITGESTQYLSINSNVAQACVPAEKSGALIYTSVNDIIISYRIIMSFTEKHGNEFWQKLGYLLL